MTNEKILEWCLSIADTLPDKKHDYYKESGFNLSFSEIQKDFNNVSDSAEKLSILCTALRNDIYRKSKKIGERGASHRAAALRLCKAAIRYSKNKTSFRGAWLDADGKQCLCDGFRAVRLNDPISDLPSAPEGERMDLDALLAPLRKGTFSLPLPSLGDLRARIELTEIEWRAYQGKKIPFFRRYDFGVDLPMVDVYLLYDLLELFPDATALLLEGDMRNRSIYFASRYGEGILLPIRKPTSQGGITFG